MKISKVNHTKSAVSVSEGSPKGILYEDPTKNGAKDLEARIIERNKAAKLLYNPINPSRSSKKTRKKINRRLMAFFNRVKKKTNGSFSWDELKKVSYDSSFDEDRDKITDLDIDSVVESCLKKSLSTPECIEAVKQITKVLCGKNTSLDLDDKLIGKLSSKLHADYSKERLLGNIKKSIENQNMVVQPARFDGESIFKLTGDNSLKENPEKVSFERFLINYANLDKKFRDDELRKLRRLIVLYFYGETEVDTTEDFDVWADHKKQRNFKWFISDNEFIAVYEKHLKELQSEDRRNRHTKISEPEFREKIRLENIYRYRNSIAVVNRSNEVYFDDPVLNKFWIHHIENSVEKLLKRVKPADSFKLNVAYIGEKVWKEVINYLSIKYIAVGKAVYRFAVNDMTYGVIPDLYKSGISSFDYELIKADESLQRDIAVSVAFAANNMARATVVLNEKSSDFLVESFKLEKSIRADIALDMAILQFFGGKSSWKQCDALRDCKYIDLLYDMKKMLYSIRNMSFHFISSEEGDNGYKTNGIIPAMFNQEITTYTAILKSKFYSNNLPAFYNDSDLEGLFKLLYKNYVERASQVPSFNSVLVRKSLPDFVKRELKIKTALSGDDLKKWHSALYYLLKEIYYNLFLASDDAKILFLKAVENNKNSNSRSVSNKNDHRREAGIDFSKRIESIKDHSLSEICQIIMTEYNQQNQSRKVKTAQDEKNKKSLFIHYKMLLNLCLRNAFKMFLDRNEFSFLKSIQNREVKSSSDEWTAAFCTDWSSNAYSMIQDEINKNSSLQSWYILSRFITTKQLNHLSGDIRHFIQYVEDVKRRAKETGNACKYDLDNKVCIYRKVLQVLDFCNKTSGIISSEIGDYFKDDDEYAKFVSNYLDFGGTTKLELIAFTNQTVGDDQINIYCNDSKPILNRNIVMAKLFAPTDTISKAIATNRNRVTVDDIEEFYSIKPVAQKFLSDGDSVAKKEKKQLIEELKKTKRYQEIVNRIEFRNIVDYAEMINDLLGQLVSWSYLRERDMMYFQLGFHYFCLNNNSDKPDKYKVLHDGDRVINNAALYQVVSLYSFDVDTFRDDNDKDGSFLNIREYSLNIGLEDEWQFYTAGLELFETVNEHDSIKKFRDYIDHFHYYTNQDRSILDMYSEVFDRFFSYDMKFRKNTVIILQNILKSYFVIMPVKFNSKTKSTDNGSKKRANVEIGEGGLKSEVFTYKYSDSWKVILPARSINYLKDVASILYYPHKTPRDAVDMEDFKKNYEVAQTLNKAKDNHHKSKKDYKNNDRPKR